jgi:hypothetical protein
MRRSSLLGLAAAVLAVCGAYAGPAEATHRDRSGWGDPYAYRYEPRGYYPYYNSGYWKPAWVMRQRPRPYYVHPPYYAAWGYPDRHYRHRDCHKVHHRHYRHGH